MAGRKLSPFRRAQDRALDKVDFTRSSDPHVDTTALEPFEPHFLGLAQAPLDAFGAHHPLYAEAPAELKDPLFIRRLAAHRAEDLPEPMDLCFAALRHFSIPAYQDGTDGYRDGIGIRTRVARLMRGIGFVKLAEELHIAKSQLSKWEHAQGATLGDDQISALAQRLDVKESWLRHADPEAIPDFLRPWHDHLEGLNHDFDVYLASVNTARMENEVKALHQGLRRHLGPHQPDPGLVDMLRKKPIVADFKPNRAHARAPTQAQDGPA